jgi:2-methylcitrate dehydratase PrpD
VADTFEAIAAYILEPPPPLPKPVVTQAKRLLLDGISWMVMGARKEEAKPLLAQHPEVDGPGACTVIGDGRRLGFLDALFANTALAQVHDCNDGRRLARRDGGSNHPGRCVIPAALTLGERHRLSGRALLDLVVMGYEIASRVQVRQPDMEYSITVAALISKLLGHDPTTACRAASLAALTFPAREHGLDDTDFDFLVQGFIARAAATAALEAGSARSLPAPRDDVQLASPLPSSGSEGANRYEILNVYIKPYPCCRALHGSIDLALEMRSLGDFAPGDIESITIRTGNRKQYLFDATDATATYKRCQFSIPYVTACALLDGDVNEATFTRGRIMARDVAELQGKIRCAYDAALEFNPTGFASHFRPSAMTITTIDGRTFSRETAAPRGSTVNPLSETELLAKFEKWMGPEVSQASKHLIVSSVHDLESMDDVSQLVRLARRG